MPRTGTRVRLAPSVYQDDTGIATVVTVGARPNHLSREKRWPLGTPLKKLIAWQESVRVELRQQVATPGARGTFAADVRRYYASGSFKDLIHQEDRRHCLEVWLPFFGHRRRATIKPHEINAQLQLWRASGLSAATCSHRLDAITQLYAVLDGPAAANPARGCVRFRKPDPVARALPLATIDRVIAEIPALLTKARRGKTIARLSLMRWTGARPSQLRRLLPSSFDLDAALPSVLIPRGKRGNAARVPLLEEGVAAARAFLASGCCASVDEHRRMRPARWSTGSTNTTITRACRRLRIARFTVYQLRHSVATALRSAGVPIEDVRDTLGHTDATTTAIYAPPVTEIQMRQFEALRMAPPDGTRRRIAI